MTRSSEVWEVETLEGDDPVEILSAGRVAKDGEKIIFPKDLAAPVICCDCGLVHEFRFGVEPDGRVSVIAHRRDDLTELERESRAETIVLHTGKSSLRP